MYVAEGHLTTQTDPATLVGQYGLYYAASFESGGYDATNVTNRDVYRLHGSEAAVASTAALLTAAGSIPGGLPVDKIESAAQAQRYVSPSSQTVAHENRHGIHLGDLVRSLVSEGQELLDGKLQVWEEARFPLPTVYARAVGRLLREVAYTPRDGWSPTNDIVSGQRTTTGLAVTNKHFRVRRLTTNTRIERRQYG